MPLFEKSNRPVDSLLTSKPEIEVWPDYKNGQYDSAATAFAFWHGSLDIYGH